MSESERQAFVEFLVSKRVRCLEYLRRVFESSSSSSDPTYWLNLIKLDSEDLEKLCPAHELAKRAQQWFILGVSLAPLLQVPNGHHFVRGLAQMIEEYEFHVGGAGTQGLKLLRAMTSSSSAPSAESESDSSNPVKPSLQKIGSSIVYEYLQAPNIPCDLDASQIIYSLCDLMSFVYRKFMDDSSSVPHIYEAILKLDGAFKHHFFGLLSRDVNTVALAKAKTQCNSLDALYASFSPEANSDWVTVDKNSA